MGETVGNEEVACTGECTGEWTGRTCDVWSVWKGERRGGKEIYSLKRSMATLS